MSLEWPPPIMACGCAANSEHKNVHDGLEASHPSCVVHECCEIGEGPDLTGRRARCSYYGHAPHKNECGKCRGQAVCTCEQNSSRSLAFFSYRGPDSHYAVDFCKCGYARSLHPSQGGTGFYVQSMWEIDHGKEPRRAERLCENNGKEFEERGANEFDEYYCGCHSWD